MIGCEIGSQGRATILRLVATAALLLVLFAPLYPLYIAVVAHAIHLPEHWKLAGLLAGYNLYALVVSESVAPWFWRFSIPACIAIGASLVGVLLYTREGARRFFLFAVLLFAGMGITGLLQTKFLLLVAPWFLLPTAVAFGTMKNRHLRIALAVSLAIAAGVGWYGVYTRRYYGAQRFTEPWARISADAAKAVQDGALVIGNNPSFFFYLTYDLRAPQTASPWRFAGSLPDDVHHQQVWSASKWEAAGHPIRPYMLWIRGTSSEQTESPTAIDAAGQWLDQRCGDRVVRHLAREAGTEWKQRFFPGYNLSWRIETRQYACDTAAVAPAPDHQAAPKPGAPH